MTLVQTQTTCGTTRHLDSNMTGYNHLKQSVRTKVGAARYIVISFFALVCVFCVLRAESCCPKAMFRSLFFAQHHPRMPRKFPGSQQSSPGSSERRCYSLFVTACLGVSSCDQSTRDNKYSQKRSSVSIALSNQRHVHMDSCKDSHWPYTGILDVHHLHLSRDHTTGFQDVIGSCRCITCDLIIVLVYTM